MYKVLISN